MALPDEREWVIETIRSAERNIERAEYPEALEVLRSVRKVEPSNMYIVAIIERVETLMRSSRKTASDLQKLIEGKTPGKGRSSVPAPVSGAGEGSASEIPPHDVPSTRDATIRRLTAAAAQLFEHGSYELAFDSLMKAYLIDPTNSAVGECEKKLLPALDDLKSLGNLSTLAEAMRQRRETSPSVELGEFLNRRGKPDGHTENDSSDQLTSLQGRLEALKQKRESDRKERERAMWRAASNPPARPSRVPRTPPGADSQRQDAGRL